MATLKDMIDEVKSNLTGYTMRQDRITYLANASGLTTTDSSIQIGSSSNLAKGIIEIDDELIWIDSFDKSSSTLTAIPGFGRGYSNTSPAPHAQYAQVTLSPTFPRVNIRKAINDTINSVYPTLWTAASYTFTFNSAQNSYALPDDCEDIIQISWETVGPSKEWKMVDKWRLDGMANSSSFNSTAAIVIFDYITPGRTVQVWYRSTPNTLDSTNEDFSDVTGLPDTCRDVITLGAAYRLLSFLDAGKINLTSAESDNADTKIPSNAGQSASKYIYALYQQRLKEENSKLTSKYPIRPHYTR